MINCSPSLTPIGLRLLHVLYSLMSQKIVDNGENVGAIMVGLMLELKKVFDTVNIIFEK